MLQQLNQLPAGLLDADARDLEGLLGGPTLIHLPGRREETLFLSVLLHGNETTGFEALQRLLRDYGPAGTEELPRALSIFIGNVSAAAKGIRRLDGQPDYNRVWPGAEDGGTPEHAMMAETLDIMMRRKLFASVDLHNNTGLNPHYACVNLIDHRFFHLATLFSRTVVYFTRPKGVQSMAFARHCPAVTLECGKVGQTLGVDHAREFLEACLHLSALPDHPIAERDIDLFHTVATVKVPDTLSFGFGINGVDLSLAEDLDRLNFRELPRDTLFGWVRPGAEVALEVRDEHGNDVAARLFSLEEGELRSRVPVMPSMLTRDETVVRQDCLCYLMERYTDHVDNPSPTDVVEAS